LRRIGEGEGVGTLLKAGDIVDGKGIGDER